ncbi:EamA family transporter [Candidatus Uhrbacteria bacterium]|nr:EamA family transporter [Candidatus Uhrbacteria bacterium]
MTWFIYAIIGHLANGVAFVIDKALLSTAFKRSATYAGLVGVLSTVVLVAIPWVPSWPNGFILLTAIASGATFIFALHAFFAALARAEASRVVPIVGSLIPILTLAGTATFLGERLGMRHIAGFALLILATAILSSSGGRGRPPRSAVLFGILSAVLFAVSTVAGKAVYDAAGFLSGFVTTRIAAAATAVILLTLADPLAGREVWGMIRPKDAASKKKSGRAAVLAVFGQSLGAVGFLFVQLGVAKGSAAIVNALQAVQYAFLVIVAFALRTRAPHLLKERFDRTATILKIVALFITAAGLWLVV